MIAVYKILRTSNIEGNNSAISFSFPFKKSKKLAFSKQKSSSITNIKHSNPFAVPLLADSSVSKNIIMLIIAYMVKTQNAIVDSVRNLRIIMNIMQKIGVKANVAFWFDIETRLH